MIGLLLFANQAVGPLSDPPTRAVLVMALLAFVLLGVALIAGAMIGARWARRCGGEDLTQPLPLRPIKELSGGGSIATQGPHYSLSPETVADPAPRRDTHAER